jgi:hypothetical protein
MNTLGSIIASVDLIARITVTYHLPFRPWPFSARRYLPYFMRAGLGALLARFATRHQQTREVCYGCPR